MPSNYFSRLRTVVQSVTQRPVLGQEGFIRDSVQLLLGKGNHRLFHTLRYSLLEDLHVLLRPGTIFAARLDLLLANQRRSLSVVGAISRPFSVPSVSGPSFQVCGYHIDRALSDSSQSSLSVNCHNKLMAASSSKAVSGELFVDYLSSRGGKLSLLTNNAGVSYVIRSLEGCRRARMSLKNSNQSNNHPFHEYILFNVAKRCWNFFPMLEAGLRGFHSSSPTSFSSGAAPESSFNAASCEEQLASSSASSEQYVPKC